MTGLGELNPGRGRGAGPCCAVRFGKRLLSGWCSDRRRKGETPRWGNTVLSSFPLLKSEGCKQQGLKHRCYHRTRAKCTWARTLVSRPYLSSTSASWTPRRRKNADWIFWGQGSRKSVTQQRTESRFKLKGQERLGQKEHWEEISEQSVMSEQHLNC